VDARVQKHKEEYQVTRNVRATRFIRKAVIGGAVAITALSAASVAGATTKLTVSAPPSAPTTLAETGSSLLYPLWNLWEPAYTHAYPSVTLSTASTGSGAGISQTLAGTANIGASDAYLSPAQLQASKNALNIPLAISSQFIAYNIPGVKTLKLSGKVISAIYQGKITAWNNSAIAKLNKGVTLPSTPIVTIHRADGSGDTFLFTQFLSATDPSGWGAKIPFGTTVPWPNATGALAETGNSGMLSGCQSTPGCIAYIGVSYLQKAQAAGLGEALLQNKAGQFVLPTTAAVNTAAASFTAKTPKNGVISMINSPAKGAYPIINYEYAIVVDNPSSATTAAAIRSVLEWAISPADGSAAAFLNAVNFEPLPAAVAAQSFAQIKKIK
jgi:phosphate transport system substrate-binding protein